MYNINNAPVNTFEERLQLLNAQIDSVQDTLTQWDKLWAEKSITNERINYNTICELNATIQELAKDKMLPFYNVNLQKIKNNFCKVDSLFKDKLLTEVSKINSLRLSTKEDMQQALKDGERLSLILRGSRSQSEFYNEEISIMLKTVASKTQEINKCLQPPQSIDEVVGTAYEVLKS